MLKNKLTVFTFTKRRWVVFTISMLLGVPLLIFIPLLCSPVLYPLMPFFQLLSIPMSGFASGAFIFLVPNGFWGWLIALSAYTFFAFCWSFFKRPIFALLVYLGLMTWLVLLVVFSSS